MTKKRRLFLNLITALLVSSTMGIVANIAGELLSINPASSHPTGGARGSALATKGDLLSQLAKLVPSDGFESDRFGQEVAISDDTIVVAAPGDDDNGDRSGSLYVFSKPLGGWTGHLIEGAKLYKPPVNGWDFFGSGLAISGNTIVASGTYNKGSVWIFTEPEQGWTGTTPYSANLQPTQGASRIGPAVAIDDETIVAGGSGSAYVFERPVGGWSGPLTPTATLIPTDTLIGNAFGAHVAIAGGTIVVGAPQDDSFGKDSGSAFVFIEPEGGWSGVLTETARLRAAEPVTDGGFGHSVSISKGTVVIGALEPTYSPPPGAGYLFTRPEGGWAGTVTETAKVFQSLGGWDWFGESVAAHGDVVLIGDPAAGRTSLYVRPEHGWAASPAEPLRFYAPDGEYRFGQSVGISGSRIVVGATDQSQYSTGDGAAYVYRFSPPGSGAGELRGFAFSAIPSPQEVDSKFPVSIMAIDGLGDLYEYNGKVSIFSNLGVASPLVAYLIEGQATLEFSVDSAGEAVLLEAHAQGVRGWSNSFVVTGGPATFGSLSGRVFALPSSSNLDLSTKAGAAGATVRLLKEGAEILSAIADSTGRFTFKDLPCAPLQLLAEDLDLELSTPIVDVNVRCGYERTQNLQLQSPDCNSAGVTPILLVPGILGSSIDTHNSALAPYLPADRLKYDDGRWGRGLPGLHDPAQRAPTSALEVGWYHLARELQEANPGYWPGCTILAVPYDWRIPLKDAVAQYLVPWIEEAKQRSPSGKVHVIAHSMGGLLVRQYVQSTLYADDIAKFAMVGTPNQGSAKAYYLWEGGDPWFVDTLDLGGPFYPLYSRTSEKQHDLFYGSWAPHLSYRLLRTTRLYKNKMRALYHDHIPSLQQLMPVYDEALAPGGGPTCDASCENGKLVPMRNDWLADLNLSVGDHLGRLGNSGGQVETVILFSYSDDATPESVIVRQETCSAVGVCLLEEDHGPYPDGEPHGLPRAAPGDGTVPTRSAKLGWITVSEQPGDKGSHGRLIRTFTPELIQYVIGDEAGTTLPSAQKTEGPTAAIDSTGPLTLNVSIVGRPQPYLVDSLGQGAGVNPTTGDSEDDIPRATVAMGYSSSSITISELEEGAYILRTLGAHDEDYSLNITLQAGDVFEEVDAQVFFSAGQTYELTVDVASSPKLRLTNIPSAPTGLAAEPLGDEPELTRLAWDIHEDPDVVEFKLYARNETSPRFNYISTHSTSPPTVDVADLWAGASEGAVRFYAVSAVRSDGTESFLSGSTRNDDRDYDGLADHEEAIIGTDPTSPDTDSDGLSDAEEQSLGTNPLVVDTDGDGYSDGFEVGGDYDPLDPTWSPADIVLMNKKWQTAIDYEACRSITAGPFVVAETAADVGFRAGSAVVLRDGFSVQSGASFVVEVDPLLSCPP